MANVDKRLDTNAAGDFYVDSTCIDCGTCRWMAPEIFDRHGSYSRVHHQPANDAQELRALKALLACPTYSIGAVEKHALQPVRASFPDPITDTVSHCGFHSEDSFGAASYFIRRPAGNIMIDSPKFYKPLVRNIEQMGGVAMMLLTHRDDVADHARFHEHFGCDRVMHARDVARGTRDIERRIDGDEPVALADDILAIPTPGHTRGSMCFLYNDEVLFSGDHVAWSHEHGHIIAFRNACWYDWDILLTSMERLAEYRFERILPGHRAPCYFPADEMADQMRTCIEWMRTQ